MDRRRLVMTGLVAGSIGLGMLIGAVVFTPGVGFAASDTQAAREVSAVCQGVLDSGPVAAAADAIGVTPAQLLSALRDGETIADVAEAHGVQTSTVVDAIVAQARERLDQAVADGTLTQAEADAKDADLERWAADLVNGEAGPPFGGDMPKPWGAPGPWGFADGPFAAAADAIGVTPAELFADLRDGSTIAEVATDHGVKVSAVVDAVVSALNDRLDVAVQNGWLTQQEADARAADLREEATALVNGDLSGRFVPGPWMGHGPGPSDGSTGSSTTTSGSPATY